MQRSKTHIRVEFRLRSDHMTYNTPKLRSTAIADTATRTHRRDRAKIILRT